MKEDEKNENIASISIVEYWLGKLKHYAGGSARGHLAHLVSDEADEMIERLKAVRRRL